MLCKMKKYALAVSLVHFTSLELPFAYSSFFSKVFTLILSFSAILCDALYPFENGRYHCTRYFYVLSRCCFSCNDGFKLSGDTCIVCLGRFGWTPKKPTCVGKLCMLLVVD